MLVFRVKRDASTTRFESLIDERFRAISDAAPVFVWTIDTERRVKYINKAWVEFTGFADEAPVGDAVSGGWLDFIHPDDIPGLMSHYDKLYAERVAMHIDNRLLTRGGVYRWIHAHNVPYFSSDGTFIGVIGWGVDITDRKEAENELQRANAELEQRIHQRTADLERTNRQLVEATRHKSDFLANMSHELRTPLNGIIGFTEFIHDGKAGPVTAQQVEYLNDVLTSANHLLRLINDVLDLAKIESGKMGLAPEVVDPAAIVSMVRDALRGMAERQGVAVVATVEPLGRIVVDPQRLKQVLFNFVANALAHTAAGGRVEIRVFGDGADRFRVEVEDTGVGIDPSDLPRLFEDFEQVSSRGAGASAGTGLGLSVARRIVEAQGGEVGVRSEPGVGSAFYAVLPREVAGPGTDQR